MFDKGCIIDAIFGRVQIFMIAKPVQVFFTFGLLIEVDINRVAIVAFLTRLLTIVGRRFVNQLLQV